MSEVGVEIVKTEEVKESGIKYLNINVSNSEVERNPDVVRLCADAGILEYVKPKPIERGTELVSVGRLETQDAYLLDILKEQGFYLMYNKKETKFGELEYWQVLYPKED